MGSDERAEGQPRRSRRRELLKRAFDIVGASVLLVGTSPILLIYAILVKLSSPGPVIFSHRRCGRYGRPFSCFKLRTMVSNAEEWLEEDEALRDRHRLSDFKLPVSKDPRVTRIGRFLRMANLDELPQLFNVLRGDMSLVGPRPVVREEVKWYGDRAEEFLSIRPGIFGAWTAMGRKRFPYPERTEVELDYVRNGTFLTDLAILARHIPVVIRGEVEE